jgi:hypothetical protein
VITPKQIDHERALPIYGNFNRKKDSFSFAKEVTRPWGGLDPILSWCKSELQHDWRWQVVDMVNDRQPGRYIFYFDNERDYLAFVLKWG